MNIISGWPDQRCCVLYVKPFIQEGSTDSTKTLWVLRKTSERIRVIVCVPRFYTYESSLYKDGHRSKRFSPTTPLFSSELVWVLRLALQYVYINAKVLGIEAPYSKRIARKALGYPGASDSWKSCCPARPPRLLPITAIASPTLRLLGLVELMFNQASLIACESALPPVSSVKSAYCTHLFVPTGSPHSAPEKAMDQTKATMHQGPRSRVLSDATDSVYDRMMTSTLPTALSRLALVLEKPRLLMIVGP